MPVRAALVQLTSIDDPVANLPVTLARVREAADGGAALILTPECTNMIAASRCRQSATLERQDADATLGALRDLAAETATHLVIGSLLLKAETDPERFVNRSFLIGPDGAIVATYDKIHMFDVDLESGESYRESAAFVAGAAAVVAQAGPARIGMSICYDLRFPGLYRALAQAGAEILSIPAAFTVPTGRAHWRALMRARAIETGCFVLAAAQCGAHAAQDGTGRRTFGHSIAVGPWGAVLAEAGETPGVTFVDLDLGDVARARAAVPSLDHDRPYSAPKPLSAD